MERAHMDVTVSIECVVNACSAIHVVCTYSKECRKLCLELMSFTEVNLTQTFAARSLAI